MQKILFVCTGNTCRSPMAQVLAQQLFDGARLGLVADSGGVFAADGAAASAHSVQVVGERYSLCLGDHAAKLVDGEMMAAAHIIVCMTVGHKSHLVAAYPELHAKIFTFGEMGEGCGDVSDPFGGSLTIYERCAAQIKSYIDKIVWEDFL